MGKNEGIWNVLDHFKYRSEKKKYKQKQKKAG